MDVTTKYCVARKKGIDFPRRRVTAVASCECLDMEDEVILASAWKYADSTAMFEKNPIGLVGHNYSSLPIFKVVRLDKNSKGLSFEAEFFTTIAAQEALTFIRDFGNASFSVGFQAVSYKDMKPSEVAKLGIDVSAAKGGRIRVYDHVRLLEISLVSIPANPLAVATAVGAAYAGGKVKGLELRKALDQIIKIKPGPEKFRTAEEVKKFLGSDEFKDHVRVAVAKARGKVF